MKAGCGNNKYLLICLFLSVPPLEGFVMNRVQGDYFETLLYKIFVSIDEQTNVAEVGFRNVSASVLL